MLFKSLLRKRNISLTLELALLTRLNFLYQINEKRTPSNPFTCFNKPDFD
jgi:hypothetical protein